MRTYRVALIGCRSRGISHARAITTHPRTELVAVSDILPERLQSVGDRFGIAARYPDFSRMLAEQQPDIVNIATATHTHAALAEAVLRKGFHVDVEKPITLTLAELDRVMDAQAASGRQVVPHHQAAVHPPARKIRELVASGAIGVPTAIRVRNKGYYGGYGIVHQGCHALALAISTVGPASSVSAHMTTLGRPTTARDILPGPYGYGLVAGQHLTCLFELEGGCYLVNEEHERADIDSGSIRFEISGTEGALALDHALPTTVYRTSAAHWHPTRTRWDEVHLSPAEREIDGHDFTDPDVQDADLWMVDEWVRALDEGRDHVISAQVGASTMEMIHGAYASHATGLRIDLPQADRRHPLATWRDAAGVQVPTQAPEEYRDWIAWALEHSDGSRR